MIKAKPVIHGESQILRDGDKKIGSINVDQKGFRIDVNNRTKHFADISELLDRVNIEFSDDFNPSKDNLFNYPYDGPVFNSVWDVQQKLPMYTKEKDSKSWFAAGYYKGKVKNKFQVMFSPKIIILQRGEYKGPFIAEPTIT